MNMNDWNEYKIGDIGTVKGGKRLPKGKMLVAQKTDHPYIRIRDLNQQKVLELNNEFEYVDDDTQKEISRYIVDEGDVLLSIVGTIGLVTIVGKSLDKANLTENCVRITNLKEISSDYLYYYLVSSKGQNEIKKGTVGAVQPKLPIYNIQDIIISAPDLDSQHNIASILSSLDDKIVVNKKICENLEAQAQALFKHWFVDFAPFKDGKFVESELGLIPEGWRVGTIQDLASKMASGGTPSSTNRDYYGGNILWFSTKELNDNFLLDSEKHITRLGLDNSSAKLFPKDTVLMAIYAAPTVGRLGILSQEATFNQAAVGIVAKEEIGYEYIYLLLLSERKNLNNLACGAAQQNLNVGLVKNYKCIIPSITALSLFREYIAHIFLQLKELQSESARLSTLRDTLLPKLMSGQIKV